MKNFLIFISCLIIGILFLKYFEKNEAQIQSLNKQITTIGKSNHALQDSVLNLIDRIDTLNTHIKNSKPLDLVELGKRLSVSVFPIKVFTEESYPDTTESDIDSSPGFTQTVMRQDTVFGMGTTFCIGMRGLFITNYHVLPQNTIAAYIEDQSGKLYPVSRIFASNQELDYVLFECNDLLAEPLFVANYMPEQGDDIFTMGNPLNFTNTLSRGIVSSLRVDDRIIQSDIPINHGSSGGPLVNKYGDVVGLVSFKVANENDLNFGFNIKYIIDDIFFDDTSAEDQYHTNPFLDYNQSIYDLPLETMRYLPNDTSLIHKLSDH